MSREDSWLSTVARGRDGEYRKEETISKAGSSWSVKHDVDVVSSDLGEK